MALMLLSYATHALLTTGVMIMKKNPSDVVVNLDDLPTTNTSTVSSTQPLFTDHNFLPVPNLTSQVDIKALIKDPDLPVDTQNVLKSVIGLANTGHKKVVSSIRVGGHVVEQGCLGVLENNGVVYVTGPGRWVAPSPLTMWLEKDISLNQNSITHGPLSIIRVPKGHYGLATYQGNPVLLAQGWHVKNDRQFTFNQLTEINVPYIQHGVIHIVRVPEGSCAKVRDNTKPFLLPPGVHVINSATFNFDEMATLDQEVIQHGTITRYRVHKGQIGLVWDNNVPKLIEKPGFYFNNQPNFCYVQSVSATNKEIILGAKKRIIVYDGEVGITYSDKGLQILDKGIHDIDNEQHKFVGFLSLKQIEIKLNHSEREHLHCETKDLVEVGIKADVFFEIIDPVKAINKIGYMDKISSSVRDNSIGTLQTIIRASDLKDAALSKKHTTTKKPQAVNDLFASDDEADSDEEEMFLTKVHDEFIHDFNEAYQDEYGIKIINMRIENFKIMNQQLADKISEQATTTAKTQTDLANLESQNQIAISKREREATIERNVADTEAYKVTTANTAKNDTRILDAQTDAQRVTIGNKAGNDARIVDAQTDAQAMQIRTDAKVAAQTQLNEVELQFLEGLVRIMGPEGAIQYQALKQWGPVLEAQLSGVEKMYITSNGNFNAMSNPMTFLSNVGKLTQDAQPSASEAEQPLQLEFGSNQQGQ